MLKKVKMTTTLFHNISYNFVFDFINENTINKFPWKRKFCAQFLIIIYSRIILLLARSASLPRSDPNVYAAKVYKYQVFDKILTKI